MLNWLWEKIQWLLMLAVSEGDPQPTAEPKKVRVVQRTSSAKPMDEDQRRLTAAQQKRERKAEKLRQHAARNGMTGG
ncbi:hypothetical protein [Burkholderia phage BCSR5]|nr:hypothetical protein [Burkholderia phage BCSR5]